MTLNLLFLLLGIALLTVGGEALIRGSLAAAKRLGVSPFLSGLVIVGFGTSAPELVVSDLLQPLSVSARILQFDQWVMLGTSILLLLFLYTGRRLSRVEGGVLLLCYGIYVGLSFAVFSS